MTRVKATINLTKSCSRNQELRGRTSLARTKQDRSCGLFSYDTGNLKSSEDEAQKSTSVQQISLEE